MHVFENVFNIICVFNGPVMFMKTTIEKWCHLYFLSFIGWKKKEMYVISVNNYSCAISEKLVKHWFSKWLNVLYCTAELSHKNNLNFIIRDGWMSFYCLILMVWHELTRKLAIFPHYTCYILNTDRPNNVCIFLKKWFIWKKEEHTS